MRRLHEEVSPERPTDDSRALRVLHVVGSVDRGGIEIWLLHLLQHLDRRRYPMDVLVLNANHGPLEQELGAAGCRVLYASNHRRPGALRRCLRDILQRYGPYDAIHSHVHYFSGAIVRAAAGLGMPIRIVHSRNDMRGVDPTRVMRRLYARWMKMWIRKFATHKLAISVSAAEDLFGPHWRAEGCAIIHSGRSFSGLVREQDRGGARRSLGLPADALVVGHVGRLQWRKNHRLIIEVANLVFRREPRARLILVGDGADEDDIRAQVMEMGIADRVVFAGARDDVPRLLMNVMDVFLFPSHHEGLGVAVVEAQAAGLPCVIAEHLPSEIDIVPDLVQRLPLTASAEDWATAVLRAAHAAAIDSDAALRAVLSTDFNIERSAGKIAQVYDAARAAPSAHRADLERGPCTRRT